MSQLAHRSVLQELEPRSALPAHETSRQKSHSHPGGRQPPAALRAPRDAQNPEPLPWASRRGHGRAGRGPSGRGWPGTPPRSLSAAGRRAARLRRAAGPGPGGLRPGAPGAPGAPRAPCPPSPPRPAAHGGRGERGEGRERPAALTLSGEPPPGPPGPGTWLRP